jgi:hypothetical protein
LLFHVERPIHQTPQLLADPAKFIALRFQAGVVGIAAHAFKSRVDVIDRLVAAAISQSALGSLAMWHSFRVFYDAVYGLIGHREGTA